MRLYDCDDLTKSEFTWESFLRHAVYCTNTQGSALYDATLGDKRLIDQMYREAMQEQSSKRRQEAEQAQEEYRPPRRGYSREVEAIYDLTDNIVAMRAESGRWPRTTTERAMTRRPWFPGEVVQDKMRNRAKAHVRGAIAAAQDRWRGIHDKPDRP